MLLNHMSFFFCWLFALSIVAVKVTLFLVPSLRVLSFRECAFIIPGDALSFSSSCSWQLVLFPRTLSKHTSFGVNARCVMISVMCCVLILNLVGRSATVPIRQPTRSGTPSSILRDADRNTDWFIVSLFLPVRGLILLVLVNTQVIFSPS